MDCWLVGLMGWMNNWLVDWKTCILNYQTSAPIGEWMWNIQPFFGNFDIQTNKLTIRTTRSDGRDHREVSLLLIEIMPMVYLADEHWNGFIQISWLNSVGWMTGSLISRTHHGWRALDARLYSMTGEWKGWLNGWMNEWFLVDVWFDNNGCIWSFDRWLNGCINGIKLEWMDG